MKCSVTCGEGKRSTVIYCKLNNMIVNTALCGSVVPRPVAILTTCVMPPCEYKKYKKVHLLKTYKNKQKIKRQKLCLDVVSQSIGIFFLFTLTRIIFLRVH